LTGIVFITNKEFVEEETGFGLKARRRAALPASRQGIR